MNDNRETLAVSLMEVLDNEGANWLVHGPFIRMIPCTRAHPVLAGRQAVALSHEVISACDAVLIMTDHDSIDYQLLGKGAKLVIDTRNACARAGVAGSNVAKA